jgi:ABC-type multidrug transport system fused ATPase/permease subunit
MKTFLEQQADLVSKAITLARPYGLKRLLVVLMSSLAQGLFQVIGVTSIFPFLALAADPGRLQRSNFGRKFLEMFPPMSETNLLVVAGVFAIAMLILSNAVSLVAEFIRNRYAANFGHWLRLKLLRNIADRPYGDFLQMNSSVLMKKVVTDVVQYINTVLIPLLDIVAKGATVIFLVGALFVVNPSIALGAAVLLGAFYLVVFRGFAQWRDRAADDMLAAGRGMYIGAHELFCGIKVVKVRGAEEYFIGRFAGHSRVAARLASRIPLLSNAPRYLVEPLAFSALVLVVLVSIARGADFVSMLPNLGVMALAGYRLLPAFQMLYSQFTVLSSSRHSLDEVYSEMLEAETATGQGNAASLPVVGALPRLTWQSEIRLEKVGFTYPNSDKPVLQDLSLTIPKNTSVGVIGETGCGKSTLIDLILGLHSPGSGRILIDGVPLSPANRRQWQQSIGYVPQDIYLIDDTIEANIAFGVPGEFVNHDRLREACVAAQIDEFIQEELPLKFATVVGERGARLSGGQKQRIGLARALYHRPELLVLDEATSALDTETESEVMSAVNRLRGKLTMIIIAHRTSTLVHCDRILDLSNPTTFHPVTVVALSHTAEKEGLPST